MLVFFFSLYFWIIFKRISLSTWLQRIKFMMTCVGQWFSIIGNVWDRKVQYLSMELIISQSRHHFPALSHLLKMNEQYEEKSRWRWRGWKWFGSLRGVFVLGNAMRVRNWYEPPPFLKDMSCRHLFYITPHIIIYIITPKIEQTPPLVLRYDPPFSYHPKTQPET